MKKLTHVVENHTSVSSILHFSSHTPSSSPSVKSQCQPHCPLPFSSCCTLLKKDRILGRPLVVKWFKSVTLKLSVLLRRSAGHFEESGWSAVARLVTATILLRPSAVVYNPKFQGYGSRFPLFPCNWSWRL